MSDEVFAPPSAEDAPEPAGDGGERRDPHLLVLRATLIALGVYGLLFAQAMPVIGAFGAATDPYIGVPKPMLFGLGMGTIAAGFVVAWSACMLVAARLLGRRNTVGWTAGLLAVGLLTALCWPVSMHGFYALLRVEGRRAYGIHS